MQKVYYQINHNTILVATARSGRSSKLGGEAIMITWDASKRVSYTTLGTTTCQCCIVSLDLITVMLHSGTFPSQGWALGFLRGYKRFLELEPRLQSYGMTSLKNCTSWWARC